MFVTVVFFCSFLAGCAASSNEQNATNGNSNIPTQTLLYSRAQQFTKLYGKPTIFFEGINVNGKLHNYEKWTWDNEGIRYTAIVVDGNVQSISTDRIKVSAE